MITVKGKRLLESADTVLYTGSLVPKEVLGWCKEGALIVSSEDMDYEEIFAFLSKYSSTNLVRLHTGDPSIYSTIAKQIEYLKKEGIEYSVVPGVTAAFGAAASMGIEYTIPGVSQTLILTRVEGATPNPEKLENILSCKNSSLVFYLSIRLLKKLKETAIRIGYSPDTPCYVIEKATWPDDAIYKGTIDDIGEKVSHIKGVALIMLGEFLNQKETVESGLYSKK